MTIECKFTDARWPGKGEVSGSVGNNLGGAVSPIDQSAPASRAPACSLVGGPAVEALRVAIAHRVLVVLSEPPIFVELFQFGFAGIVIDLVGKVRGKNKRFVTDDADGEGKGELVAFHPDVN